MAKKSTGEEISTLLAKGDGQTTTTPLAEQIKQAGGDVDGNKRKVEIAKKDLERRTLRAKRKKMVFKKPNGMGVIKKKRLIQRGVASKFSDQRRAR
tara:strand:- start:689 stop:976 length:288 start_codon:yes stop_codon:yes gene_type:complete